METTHSPAPWIHFENGNIHDAAGKIIAKLPLNDQMRDEEQISNIGLVIAAPELLAALEAMLDAPDDDSRYNAALDARAALARAKGRPQD